MSANDSTKDFPFGVDGTGEAELALDGSSEQEDKARKDKALDMPAGARGRTALHMAAIHGDSTILQLLLSTCAFVNSRDSLGKTAVHYAAEHGKYEVLGLLHQKGADLEARDLVGRTALHTAVMAGQRAVVEFLTDSRLCVEIKDTHGLTALHYAVYLGKEEIVRRLVYQGADANAMTR